MKISFLLQNLLQNVRENLVLSEKISIVSEKILIESEKILVVSGKILVVREKILVLREKNYKRPSGKRENSQFSK